MDRIMGNPTATPMKVPDWNQNDPKKADYIKNKPEAEIEAVKRLLRYGDANIIPSDASLFEFTHSPIGGGVAIEHVANTLPKDVVIPFEATVDGETLPVTFLWDMFFASNDDVENLVIPNTVVEIGVSAFEGCTSLKSITIPDSVTNICADAFFGCQNLEDVYFTGTKAQWDAITIGTGNLELDRDRVAIHFKWSEDIGKIDEALEELHNYAQALIGGAE